MDIAFQNKHMFASPSGWLVGRLVASSNPGYNRIALPTGEVLSVNPDTGNYETRSGDTDGPWEQCKRAGNAVSYSQAWAGQRRPYVVIIAEV